MGVQGEIYTFLGLKVDAHEIVPCTLYDVLGKKIKTDDNVSEFDFLHHLSEPNLHSPSLDVHLEGYYQNDYFAANSHFKGSALIGYTLDQTCYVGEHVQLVSQEEVNALKRKLCCDISDKFGRPTISGELNEYLIFSSVVDSAL